MGMTAKMMPTVIYANRYVIIASLPFSPVLIYTQYIFAATSGIHGYGLLFVDVWRCTVSPTHAHHPVTI